MILVLLSSSSSLSEQAEGCCCQKIRNLFILPVHQWLCVQTVGTRCAPCRGRRCAQSPHGFNKLTGVGSLETLRDPGLAKATMGSGCQGTEQYLQQRQWASSAVPLGSWALEGVSGGRLEHPPSQGRNLPPDFQTEEAVCSYRKAATDRATAAPALTDRSHNPSHPRLSHTRCFSLLWKEQFAMRLFPHPHDYSSVSWKHQALQASFLQQSFVRPGLQISERFSGLATL